MRRTKNRVWEMANEDGEDIALRVQRVLHAFSGVLIPALGLAERLHGFVR